jgi:hypothetical protein
MLRNATILRLGEDFNSKSFSEYFDKEDNQKQILTKENFSKKILMNSFDDS